MPFKESSTAKQLLPKTFFESTGQVNHEATKWLVIDWEATYNYSLQFDFFNYKIRDTEGNYRMFFWNANA